MQSVDGIEAVTQDWMVPDQIEVDIERRRNKVILLVEHFENDHKSKRVKFAEEKEKGRRIADSNKPAKFAPTKNHAKRKLNTVAEEGLSSPRCGPRVADSNRPNYAEVDVDGLQGKRPRVDDHSDVVVEGPSKLARGNVAGEGLDDDSGGEDVDGGKVYTIFFGFLVLLNFLMSY